MLVLRTRAVSPVLTWRHATTFHIRHRRTWDEDLRLVGIVGPRPLTAEHLQVVLTGSVVLLSRHEIWNAQPHRRVLLSRIVVRVDRAQK